MASPWLGRLLNYQGCSCSAGAVANAALSLARGRGQCTPHLQQRLWVRDQHVLQQCLRERGVTGCVHLFSCVHSKYSALLAVCLGCCQHAWRWGDTAHCSDTCGSPAARDTCLRVPYVVHMDAWHGRHRTGDPCVWLMLHMHGIGSRVGACAGAPARVRRGGGLWVNSHARPSTGRTMHAHVNATMQRSCGPLTHLPEQLVEASGAECTFRSLWRGPARLGAPIWRVWCFNSESRGIGIILAR